MPNPTPPLATADVAERAVEDALAAEFPRAPTRLSKKGASQMYFGGPPLSHREAAAAERERPSQRAGDTEVRVFMEVRMPAATPGASH